MYRKEIAASKIQAAWRGYQARKNIKDYETTKSTGKTKSNFMNANEKDSKDPGASNSDQHMKETASATKIQAAFRGYRARKSLKNDKDAFLTKNSNQSNCACVNETLEVNAPSKLGTNHVVYTASVIEYSEDHQKIYSRSSQSKNLEGYILATGGFRTDGVKDNFDGKRILIYNPAEDVWYRYGTMEKARSHYGLILLDEELYFIGGCTPVKTSSENMMSDRNCFKLNLKSREWKDISKMKYSRMYHGVAEFNGKIYVIGGRDNDDRFLKSMEVYDPQTDTWDELHESLEKPIMGAGVCTYDTKIWIVGGMVQERNGLPLVKEVKCYDPEKKKFDQDVMDLPFPRVFSTVTSFENEIYVVGGTSEIDAAIKDELCSVLDVLIYNKKENLWTVVTNLPSQRHFLTACITGSNLYVLGGFEHVTGKCVKEVIVYKKKTGKWLPCASLPEFLCGFNFIWIPEDFYI